MNLQDQVIYRCIHAACARQLPRRVNFCPWCGTGQHDGVVNPSHVARPVQAEYLVERQTEGQGGHQVEYQAAYESERAVEADEAAVVPEMAAAPVIVVPEALPPAAPPPPPAPPPSPPPPTPPLAKPAPMGAAAPPRREPVRLRWWLVALAALWLIWIYAKPNAAKKIESRIESAMTASAECRLNDAQSELIALRMTRATPAQLERLQSAISTASATCGKKKQRDKAWGDTTNAVESALAEGDFGRAQARLSQFTKRWNEDEESRKLKARINERRAAAPPLAPLPPPEVIERSRPVLPAPAPGQSARNLIDEAERALRAGNYRAAVDKLETCITMVDEGNRECAAFKVHADRMLRERERCVAAGRVWVEDRCI
ncbi:hypothetical protein [Massilia sp. TSP1-1-2]|uniref:hypothetical protein n=1 Tax=Massilia sp. TSP1-1-2 TaxID=2804649 RepID=UPI003CF8779D